MTSIDRAVAMIRADRQKALRDSARLRGDCLVCCRRPRTQGPLSAIHEAPP